MSSVRTLMKTQPALVVGLIEAVLIAAAAFGLDLSAEQIAAVGAVIVAAGAVWTRSKVWPEASVDRETDAAYERGLAAGDGPHTDGIADDR